MTNVTSDMFVIRMLQVKMFRKCQIFSSCFDILVAIAKQVLIDREKEEAEKNMSTVLASGNPLNGENSADSIA